MKSIFDRAPASAARAGIAFALCSMGLAGCSTVKSISPFTSSVPYAQNIQPTLPRPAQPEVPVYKKSPVEAEAEAAPPAPAHSAAPTPAPSPAPAASPPQAESQPISPPPAAASPPPPPPQTNSATDQNDGAQPPAAQSTKKGDAPPPTIPAERMAFQDDGQYRNLAQVPVRPKDLPTFAEARATERALSTDRNTGANAPTEPLAGPATPVASRAEDKAPCRDTGSAGRPPTATVHFDHGSSTLPADQSGVLSDAMADIRSSNGTIRIVGHGDSDVGAAQGTARFDLAMARAGAVADALAGFGIPPQRIALVVACGDGPTVGASVQLYTNS